MTNYVIGHLPYGSSRFGDDHCLAIEQRPHQTDEWLADLVRVDELVVSDHSRLCCDVGVYMRASDGPAADLIPVLDQDDRRLRDEPSEEQIAAALALAREHVLRLCTRIEHSRVWLPTIVLDLIDFGNQKRLLTDARPACDICLGFNGDATPPLVNAMKAFFGQHGLSVRLNEPLSGCLLPAKYIGDDSVVGLTLGVHRRLCVDGHSAHINSKGRCDQLRALFEDLYSLLSSFGC